MGFPILFNDPIYQRCIRLAMNSKSKFERYGSMIIKDNQDLGGGWNRALSNPAWNYKLERIVKQGYANHAEVEAINVPLMKGIKDLEGSEVYVAGFFNKTNQLFFQDRYTCTICPPKLIDYGVKNIIIPTLDGWKERPIEEALEEARDFRKGGTTNNRLRHCQGDFYLKDFLETQRS